MSFSLDRHDLCLVFASFAAQELEMYVMLAVKVVDLKYQPYLTWHSK